MITILGPTACGKTQLAVALAAKLNAEIISADSRQVYRGMDIGTGKDLDDYIYNGVQRIPYHLIDICEPGEKYNVYRFQHDFEEVYAELQQRQCPAILCGGSGLYIEAVLRNYQLPTVPQNPTLRNELEALTLQQLTDKLRELKKRNGSQLHNHTDVDTKKRAIRAIEIEEYILKETEVEVKVDYAQTRGASREIGKGAVSLVVGIDIPREERRQRISQRLRQRLEQGMVEEVRRLLDTKCTPQQLIYYGLEYRYLTQYIIGELTYDQMVAQLEIAIHQFAKRQMTWFRGMERRGVRIHWINYKVSMEEKVQCVMHLIENATP